MNLFFLSTSPKEAAAQHYDVHVVKIILEVTQLLMAAHWVIGTGRGSWRRAKAKCKGYKYDKEAPIVGAETWEEVVRGRAAFGLTHENHPLAQWVRASESNYRWAALYAVELSKEFARRRRKAHGCTEKIKWLAKHLPCPHGGTKCAQWPEPKYSDATVLHTDLAEKWGCTPVPCCVSDTSQLSSLVESYQAYYKEKKGLEYKMNLRAVLARQEAKEREQKSKEMRKAAAQVIPPPPNPPVCMVARSTVFVNIELGKRAWSQLDPVPGPNS